MCTEAHVQLRQILIVFMYGARYRSEAGAGGKVLFSRHRVNDRAAGHCPRCDQLWATRTAHNGSMAAQNWATDPSPALRASRALRTRPRSLRTSSMHIAATTICPRCSLKIKISITFCSGKIYHNSPSNIV